MPRTESRAQPTVVTASAAPREVAPASATGRSAVGLVAVLGAAGVLHFAKPRAYEPLIPARLGSPRAWVLASGLAELACAAAVAWPRTRRAGALASAALFVVVFPGNVKMALDAGPPGRPWARRSSIAWARLPLQVPLVRWATNVARGAARA